MIELKSGMGQVVLDHLRQFTELPSRGNSLLNE